MADTVDVLPLGGGVYRVTDGTRTRLGYATGPAEARWVFLEGHVFIVEATPQDAVRRRSRHHDEGALAAPMPATVVRILVRPGNKVQTGDVLVVLDAMKMELPIKAPRDAVIKTIGCSEGQLVQPGMPLLEIE